MKKILQSKPRKDVPGKGPGQSIRRYIEKVRPHVEKDGLRNQSAPRDSEEERWRWEQAILRQAAERLARQRNGTKTILPSSLRFDSFDELTEDLEDPSPQVRHQAVRALYELDADRAASFFSVALREGSPAERRNIGAALAGSGLLDEAIEDLTGDNPENSYCAFSFLFLVAKAGEIQPLIKVIKGHPSIELRLTLIKLLTASGDSEVIPAYRRLLGNSLPPEVRAAITEAINQIDGQRTGTTSSAA